MSGGWRRCRDDSPDYEGKHYLGLGDAVSAVFPGMVQTLDATFTDDEKVMMFTACPAGSIWDAACDIYEARFSYEHLDEIRKPLNLSSATTYDRHPTLSPDGKRLFLVRGPKETIYVSYRLRVRDEFPPPVPFVSVDNVDGVDTDPFFGRNGRLYFVRNPLLGVGDIYSVEAASLSITGAVRLGDFSGKGPVIDDAFATRLFFARTSAALNGQYQINVAERNGGAYSEADDRYVSAINDDGKTSNVPNWISSDKCVLYFSRDVGADTGSQIWRARRRTPPGGP